MTSEMKYTQAHLNKAVSQAVLKERTLLVSLAGDGFTVFANRIQERIKLDLPPGAPQPLR